MPRIDDMMAQKVAKPLYIYSGEVAEDQYVTCIQKLVEIITESYRVFDRTAVMIENIILLIQGVN